MQAGDGERVRALFDERGRNQAEIVGLCFEAFFFQHFVQLFSLRNPVLEKTAAFVCELRGGVGFPALFGEAYVQHFQRKIVFQQQGVDSGQILEDCVNRLGFGAFPPADKRAVRRVRFYCLFTDERVDDCYFFASRKKRAGLFGEFGDV